MIKIKNHSKEQYEFITQRCVNDGRMGRMCVLLVKIEPRLELVTSWELSAIREATMRQELNKPYLMKKSLILTLIITCVFALSSCMGETAEPSFSLETDVVDYQQLKEQLTDTDTLKGGCSICPPG